MLNNIIDIVWRLDFDTTWLVFLTNNWDLTHKIINPKKVDKARDKFESKIDEVKDNLEKIKSEMKDTKE